jgi:hypothetical protein
VAHMREERKSYRALVGKRERKRPKCTWEDGIRMDLRKIGWGSVELAQDRGWWWALMNMVINLQVLAPRS